MSYLENTSTPIMRLAVYPFPLGNYVFGGQNANEGLMILEYDSPTGGRIAVPIKTYNKANIEAYLQSTQLNSDFIISSSDKNNEFVVIRITNIIGLIEEEEKRYVYEFERIEDANWPTMKNGINGIVNVRLVINSAGGAGVGTPVDHSDLTGTGLNTHPQIDAHISASATVHGILGSVVGTTDNQTLTNKIIDDATNTVRADKLKAVVISATAPSAGQILSASDGTNASWINPTSGVTDHTLLTNIGTNTHANIDSHISATTAHGATGAVVGTTNTQSLINKTMTDTSNIIRATQLKAIGIGNTLPNDGEVLVYRNANLELRYEPLPSAPITVHRGELIYNQPVGSGTNIAVNTSTVTPIVVTTALGAQNGFSQPSDSVIQLTGTSGIYFVNVNLTSQYNTNGSAGFRGRIMVAGGIENEFFWRGGVMSVASSCICAMNTNDQISVNCLALTENGTINVNQLSIQVFRIA